MPLLINIKSRGLKFLKTFVPEKSLSNSDYFTLAKKCRRESCLIDFTSAKMNSTNRLIF